MEQEILGFDLGGGRMSLNSIPSSERIHIGFFGRRNAGKSSLINAVTGQKLSIVSDVLGTTTDPVFKSMEILPLGPVVIIDTPGIDDQGELGALRVKRAYDVLNRCNMAVVVVDCNIGITSYEEKLIEILKEKEIPYIVCFNKDDHKEYKTSSINEIAVSSQNGHNIKELRQKLATLVENKPEKYIIAHKLRQGDIVVLVMPIDEAAPKGRIILPQQQTLREVLDSKAVAICVQPSELDGVIKQFGQKIRVVITDSQAFAEVSKIVPDEIYLTSFSILMMNYKGELSVAANNANVISLLKSGDKVLIAEGCTHHKQCNDIGTVKLPTLIRKTCGCHVEFDFTSGYEFPENLSQYKLIVQCGGCMLSQKEVMNRIESASIAGVPITNYGVALAYMNGILERALEFLKE